MTLYNNVTFSIILLESPYTSMTFPLSHAYFQEGCTRTRGEKAVTQQQLEEEQRMLSTLSPAAAKEWWHNKNDDEEEQRQ
jgi:hypothetical protein